MPSEVILPPAIRAQVLASNQFGPGQRTGRVGISPCWDHWYGMRFLKKSPSLRPRSLRVNQVIQVTAQVQLGALTPDDIQVELYQGTVGC